MSRLRRWRQRLGLRRGDDLGGGMVVRVPEQNALVAKGYHGQGLVHDPLLGLLAVLEVPGGPRRLDPAAKGNGTIRERPREGPMVSRERTRASCTPRRCSLGPEDFAGRGDELPLLVDGRAHDDRPAREEVRRGLAVLAKERSEVVEGRVAGALDLLELLSRVVLLLRLPGPPRAAPLQGAYERGRSGGSQGREGSPGAGRERFRTTPRASAMKKGSRECAGVAAATSPPVACARRGMGARFGAAEPSVGRSSDPREETRRRFRRAAPRPPDGRVDRQAVNRRAPLLGDPRQHGLRRRAGVFGARTHAKGASLASVRREATKNSVMRSVSNFFI